jgi:hypothetical protein
MTTTQVLISLSNTFHDTSYVCCSDIRNIFAIINVSPKFSLTIQGDFLNHLSAQFISDNIDKHKQNMFLRKKNFNKEMVKSLE